MALARRQGRPTGRRLQAQGQPFSVQSSFLVSALLRIRPARVSSRRILLPQHRRTRQLQKRIFKCGVLRGEARHCDSRPYEQRVDLCRFQPAVWSDLKAGPITGHRATEPAEQSVGMFRLINVDNDLLLTSLEEFFLRTFKHESAL